MRPERKNRGESYLSTVCVALALVCVFAVVVLYARTVWMADGVRESVSQLLDGFLVEVSREDYGSLKNGRSSLRRDLYPTLSRRIGETLGTGAWGDGYARDPSGEKLYRLENLSVTENGSERFLTVSFSLWVPLRLGSALLGEIEIPLTVRGYYVEK